MWGIMPHTVNGHSGTRILARKAFATLGLVGVSMLALAACAPRRPSPHHGDLTAREQVSKLHFVGRVAHLPDGRIEYAWPGTGFVAKFVGTGVAIRLEDDKSEHQVVIDGRVLAKLVTRAEVKRYALADHLRSGTHRLEVYRRTEPFVGVTRLVGIDVERGRLLAPDPSPRRQIEVVGDSISCGYGIEGTSTSCHFSADTENHYLSYSALLARNLNAEVSTVAWSGRGVVKNYAGGSGERMGELYDRILPESPASRWVPGTSSDAVIVNLGTNDYSTEPDPEAATFVRAYVELLGRIRRNNPRAIILCTIGPMLAGPDLEKAEATIVEAVAQRQAAGDKRLLYHRLKTENQDPGCDWHPGLATHQRIADELASPLRAALGW
jgi:lysophospholipase L1-like esterase